MNTENNYQPDEKNKVFNIYQLVPAISTVKASILGLLGIFFLYQLGGGILSLIAFGLNMESANPNAVRLMTAAGQILLILLPTLLLTKSIYKNITIALRVKFPTSLEILIFVLGLIILTPLMQSYLFIQSYVINLIAEQSHLINEIKNALDKIDSMLNATYKTILTGNNFAEVILIVFIIAIVPAFCEEFFFRGYVQTGFEYKYKGLKGIALTALFFSLYHLSPYLFIPLAALGFYLGYAVHKSNSIFIGVILHFLNNFFSYLMFLIFGEEELATPAISDTTLIIPQLLLFTLLLIVFFIFIFLVRQYYKRKKSSGGKNDLP